MEIINILITFIKQNQFIFGGVLMAIIAYGGNFLKSLPNRVLTYFYKFIFLSVRVNTDNFLYDHLELFLKKK